VRVAPGKLGRGVAFEPGVDARLGVDDTTRDAGALGDEVSFVVDDGRG
jgi:hypothetical protein